MISIWLEGLPLRLSPDAIYTLVMSHLPRVITSTEGLSPAEQAMRAIAKPAIRSLLFIMRRELAAAGAADDMLPRPPKGEDVVLYGVRWMLAATLGAAQGTEWDAQFTEESDGLHVTGMAPRAGTAAPLAPDALATAGGAPGADAQAGDAADHAAALRLAR